MAFTRVTEQDLFPGDRFLYEIKSGVEGLASEHFGQPMAVIFPHFVEWDVVDIDPKRIGLDGSGGRAVEFCADIDMAMNVWNVGHSKAEFTHLERIKRSDVQLFLALTDNRLLGSLSGVDLPSRAIDLSFANSRKLMDQQDLVATAHKHQRCLDAGLPIFPVGSRFSRFSIFAGRFHGLNSRS